MQGLQLPLIPLNDEESGEYLVFLPHVDTEELEQIGTEIHEDEEIFEIYCIYGENEDGEMLGDSYPLEINEVNRPQIEDLEQLVVMHPDDQPVESMTDDPEMQEQLEDLYDHIRDLEKQYEENVEDGQRPT